MNDDEQNFYFISHSVYKQTAKNIDHVKITSTRVFVEFPRLCSKNSQDDVKIPKLIAKIV